MDREDWTGFWGAAGGLSALAVGIVLIPLRTVTSASNLAFPFVALTIVVAETGGRRAGLVTALVSAMSLNFFLTEPYLTLAINKADDIIAFVALTACGLIAAAFGRRRERWSTAARRTREELDVLTGCVDHLRAGTSLDEILSHVRRALRLGIVVLRGPDDRPLAVAPPEARPELIPDTLLEPETVLPAGQLGPRLGTRGVRVPEGGGRLRLQTDHGVYSLDLWEGDPAGLSAGEWRTLSVAAWVLTLEPSRVSKRISSG